MTPMPTSFSQLMELVSHSIGDWTASGLMLKAALIACSVFATVQLLSMLGTRYGDANTTSKSFFLSLIVHCCLGLGWATIVHSSGPNLEMPVRSIRADNWFSKTPRV